MPNRTFALGLALAGVLLSGGCFRRVELAMPAFDRPILMNDALLVTPAGAGAAVRSVMPFTCAVSRNANWFGDPDSIEIYEDYVVANLMPALTAVANAGPRTYVRNAAADALAWTTFAFIYAGDHTRIMLNGETASLEAPIEGSVQ